MIGEFTTEADPIMIDWYLILVKTTNEVVYIPAYAVGFQEALKKLSKVLEHEIVPTLFASTEFDSNVLFPSTLENEKLFYFEGLNPTGFWNKMQVKSGIKPITPRLLSNISTFTK